MLDAATTSIAPASRPGKARVTSYPSLLAAPQRVNVPGWCLVHRFASSEERRAGSRKPGRAYPDVDQAGDVTVTQGRPRSHRALLRDRRRPLSRNSRSAMRTGYCYRSPREVSSLGVAGRVSYARARAHGAYVGADQNTMERLSLPYQTSQPA